MGRTRKKIAESLSASEVATLIDTESRSPTGLRNRALVAVLYHAGLRIGEALRLRIADIDLNSGVIRIPTDNPEPRTSVEVTETAKAHLMPWLQARATLSIDKRQPLFCTLSGGELSDRYVRQFISRLAIKAGIGKTVHPRGLRNSRTAHLAAQEVPLIAIQSQLGHADQVATEHYLHSVGLDATSLERWADKREAQSLLPKVIRQLVQATTTPRLASFRAGEGVQLGGWDGLVQVDVGNAYVPAGGSGWELGTGKDVPSKASKDFASRSSGSQVVDRKGTTFVFVTARRWRDKHQWAAEREAEGIWAGVRAYDADDLEQWLEQAPAVAAWFGSIVGTRPPGVGALVDVWPSFAITTAPSLSKNLILAGRGEQQKAFAEWIQGPPSILEIEGESQLEALAFVSAALESLPPDKIDHWKARSLVLDDASIWSRITGKKVGLLIVPCAGNPSNVSAIRSEGNHVLLPLGAGSHRAGTAIVLNRIPQQEFEAALKEMSLSAPQAASLSRDLGRSIIVLQRRLALAPSLAEPPWAKPESAPNLLPALLAGGWDESSEADCEILAHLAGKDYAVLACELARWTQGPDAPLKRLATVWRLTAPLDAWLLIARYLSDRNLAHLRTVVQQVLGEDDPRFELPPDQRWTSAIYGKSPRYSNWLREGLTQTLALAAVHGAKSEMNIAGRIEDLVSSAVRKLLGNATGSRWGSLCPYLLTLAEAAPRSFLSALEDSLDQNPPPVMDLFVEEGFLGRSGYSYLQWALEVLAWEPAYLAQATAALGRLARLDPGGRYANRPASSLREIFLPWLPQTSASLEERLAVIDLLVQAEPKVGWKLLLGLLPLDHDSVMPIQRPRWRDWDSSAKPLTTGERDNFSAAIQQKTLETARTKVDLWREIVERITSFRPHFRQQMRDALRGLSTQPSLSESVRLGLSDELRKVVARHRQFPSADWALPAKEIDELEEILKVTEPANLASRFAWLFESSWPELPRPEIQDYEEQARAIQMERDNAIATTVGSEGIESVIRLARSAKLPEEVGGSLARTFGDAESTLLPATLGSQETAIRSFALAFVRQRFLSAGQSWGDAMLARAREQQWTPDRVIDLCCGFTPGFETWKRVQELGGELEASYWKRINIWHLKNPAERDKAIEHLVAAGRPGNAVHLAWLAKNEVISSELVAQVLEVLALQSQSGEQRVPQWYEVKGLFEILEAKQDLDRNRLARLEWQYFDLLRNSSCPPKTLFEFISGDPAFFATLVSWVYKPDDGTDFDDDLGEEQRASRRLRAYHLLESMIPIPGLREDGSIDEIALQAWVEAARAHCAQLKRLIMGDETIGKILATSPLGKDDIWPAEPIRSVLERVRSQKLETGLTVGKFNNRGMVSRVLGGEEERELERTYRRYAAALASSSPRTASALRELADSYGAYARHEEHRTALEELEF